MRTALATLLAAGLLAAGVPSASAGEWRSEQPNEPAIGVPVPLGAIGDVEFWAPNRGMLITAGNDAIPAGLYAYDGTGWYPYSTVCGGHGGRIAWAGPNDFWTIADQQKGQQTGEPPAQHISLCHFVDGRVVASYAKPVGAADSYLPLNAAACLSPSDCWFAGERLPESAVNVGAFHLHWNGSSVTPVPSLGEEQFELSDPGRTVTDLAVDEDAEGARRLYESVAVEAEDNAPGETAANLSLVHQVLGAEPTPFAPLFGLAPIEYGGGSGATQLEGFRLADGGEGPWALAGALAPPANPVVLRVDSGVGAFGQVKLTDPGGLLGSGTRFGGVAAEPGTGSILVSIAQPSEGPFSSARIARIQGNGTVSSEVVLPASGGALDPKGTAGPIACPAAEQCWLATSKGWLFHLGPDLAQDTDPALHTLTTTRPPDESLPVEPPNSLPTDDSGADQVDDETEPPLRPLRTRKVLALVAHIHSELVGRSVLEMSFVLRAKAHVRLVAELKGDVVAKTRLYTFAKGKHRLRLALDPDRWPTKLDLQAHPVKKKGRR